MAAPIAAPPTTYAFIPPPPLPEFYLPKKAGSSHESASSTSAEDAPQALVGSMTKVRVSRPSRLQTSEDNGCDIALPPQQPAAPGDATDETMIKFTRTRTTSAPFANLPPPPPGFGGYDVPPLAVYHICRICIRPRSAKYHREHPIPINGVPPPPGICRRCRVTQVEEEVVTETKVSRPKKKELVDVVKRGESNEIKLGVACIVPEEDYVPMQEMKDRRGRRLLRELDRQQHSRHVSEETGEEREITYRHVRVRETERTVSPAPAREGFRIPPLPPPQPRKPKTTISSTSQDAIDAVSIRSQEIFMTTAAAAATDLQIQPTQMPSSRSVRSVRVTEIVKEDTAKGSSSASSSTSTPSGPKASTRAISVAVRPERTDSQTRKIAREEVEKYRQAERKLEAHPDAYAHGRMIPVQRRIERQADIAEPLPWDKESDHFEVRVEREKDAVRASAPPSRQYQPNERASRVEKEWRVGKAQTERSEKYTGSGWSEARSHRDEEREIVIERVVRRESQPVESQRGSGSRQSGTQPAAKDLPDNVSTTMGTRSVTSDKTRWARTTEEPKRGKDPAASDGPPSVKMREVVGWDDAPASYTTREIWLPPGSQYDVIEVVEEVELPPDSSKSAPRLRGGGPKSATPTDSRISERVGELQEDAERQDRAQRADSPPRRPPASTRSSRPSERDYMNDDGADGTASRRSSRYQEPETDTDVRYRQEQVRSEAVRGPSALSERTIRSQHSRHTQASRQTAEPAEGAPKESERVRAFDRRMAALEAHKAEAISLREERSTDRRRHDADAASSRPSVPPAPAPSSRSARSPEREREREYIHVERRVQSADVPIDNRSPNDRAGNYYIDTEELWRFSSSKPNADARPQSQLNKAHQNAPEERQRREQRRDSPSETSTRVRFAKKVDISPTPPGSDASSAQFRNYGARGGKGRPKESAVESGEDLIAEYERRGRARARDRAAPAAEERQKVYTIESRQGVEERPRMDGVDDAAYRPRMSRPLARALSESPSRERLSEVFSEHRSKVSSAKVDGFGPYRPEQPRTGSVEVWGGSEHASRAGSRVEHSFGGWAEDVPGGPARW